MGQAVIILTGRETREQFCRWVMAAPMRTIASLKGVKRSIPQNSRFWASLTDVARQVTWHGVRLNTEDWKLVFLDALKKEMRLVPNINGDGFVNLGRSSSSLTVEEMSDLLEVIYAFGAQHGVVFGDEQQVAA